MATAEVKITNTYLDGRNRVLFIHDGISGGQRFGTFYQKLNRSLKRVVSKNLPLQITRELARADLDNYAVKKHFPKIPYQQPKGT